MPKKPAKKALAKKSMKRTKGGLIGLLVPPVGINVPGIKVGSPIGQTPTNKIPPVPCI